ncbi:MAG: hypothetical protein ACLFNO_03350 [Parcubacteria group bacterium]
MRKFSSSLNTKALKRDQVSMSDIHAHISSKENNGFKINNNINLTLDYSMNVEEMMQVAGLYSKHVNSENFPIPKKMRGKKVDINIRLFHFNRPISTEEAIFEINKDSFRGANIFEQVTFAAHYPQMQRQFPIVAFGSTWQAPGFAIKFVPVLFFGGYDRPLSLGWFHERWPYYYRFLGVAV